MTMTESVDTVAVGYALSAFMLISPGVSCVVILPLIGLGNPVLRIAAFWVDAWLKPLTRPGGRACLGVVTQHSRRREPDGFSTRNSAMQSRPIVTCYMIWG
jgi:hypothetical protein